MRQRGFIFAPLLIQALPYIIVAVLIAGTVYWFYDFAYDRGASQVQSKWDAAVVAQREAEAKRSNAASTKLEAGNAQAKVVYRTITRTVDKVIDRPVYRNVCIDTDGMQLANAALRGALAPAGEPDRRVPALDAARGRNGGGSAAENRRGE